MIVCANCGTRNPDGERFCQVCGNFLAWQARTPEPPVGTEPAEPTPNPTPNPAADQPDSAASAPTTSVPGSSTRIPPAAASPAPAPSAPASRVGAGPPGSTAGPPGPPGPAGAEPAVTGETEPLGLVRPGKPVESRPVLRDYQESAAPTQGVVCPVCATVNPRDRQLCRRCGSSLAGAVETEQKVPWWRRLRLPRIGRGWSALRRLLVLALGVILVLLLVWAGMTYGPRGVEAIRDRFATPQPIQPVGASASSVAPGHPAAAVMDGFTNRYWAPAQPGQGLGEFVELRFGSPFRMLSVIVQSGISNQQDQFVTEARPAQLKLTTWDSAGTAKDTELRLADRPGEQRFDRAIGDVTRLRLTVEAVYGMADGRRPAIAELEVFERR